MGWRIYPHTVHIALTAVVDGKNGLWSLLSRMGYWRVDVYWYAMVLLFPVLIMAVLMILSALISPVFAPSFTVIGIVIGLIVGFCEEIGWTGFALPKLQVKYSSLDFLFIQVNIARLVEFGQDCLT